MSRQNATRGLVVLDKPGLELYFKLRQWFFDRGATGFDGVS